MGYFEKRFYLKSLERLKLMALRDHDLSLVFKIESDIKELKAIKIKKRGA